MKYVQKIVGESVYLSPVHTDDAETYIRWLNDFRVTDGLGQSTTTLSLREEHEWLERAQSSNGNHDFAIVRLSDDKLLGNGSLFNLRAPSMHAETGLFIGEAENRGKGYGTQALRLLVSYGFFYLNLHNIMLKVFSFNEAAIGMYQKIGFREIGRRRQSYFLNGKRYDDVMMDILREEFPINYIKNAQER